MNQHVSPERAYAPAQSAGCFRIASNAAAVFLLVFLGGAIFMYHPVIIQTFDDARRLPARVKALEESVRSTNDTFTKYLKP